MRDDGIWLRTSEAVDLLGCHKTSVTRNIDKFVHKVVISNGGKTYFINLQSLPVEAQAKYYKKVYPQCEPETKSEVVANIEPPKPPNLNMIPPKKNKEAALKYALVNRYLEYCEGRYLDKVQAKQEFEELLKHAKEYEVYREVLGCVDWKSIERWKKMLEENNWDYFCLINRHNGRPRSITDVESEIIVPFILHPNKLSVNEIIRYTKKRLLELNIEPKSSSTYRRYISNWIKKNNNIYNFAIHGQKGLNDKNLPDVFRNYDKIEVGDIIVADGHKLNFNILDINGKPRRAQIILFYDMKSSMPLGYEIDFTENTKSILSALRRTISILGFTPKIVYLDNGRAFRSKYFNGVKDFRDSDVDGAFKRLGIRPMFATPYHGQSKTIERFFGILHEYEKMLPTYVGNTIENQPARLHRNEKYHKALYGDVAFSVETIVEGLTRFFKEYAFREHVGGYYKGLKPIEVFAKSLEKVKAEENFAKRQLKPEEMNFLMLDGITRNISKNGVRMFGKYYWSEELFGLSGEVVVRYDILDTEEVLIYDLGGRFIAKASCKEGIHPAANQFDDENDYNSLQEQLQLKGRLRKDTVMVHKAIMGNQNIWGPEPEKEPVKKPAKLDPFNCGLKLTAGDIIKEEETPIFVFESDKEEYYKKKYKN